MRSFVARACGGRYTRILACLDIQLFAPDTNIFAGYNSVSLIEEMDDASYSFSVRLFACRQYAYRLLVGEGRFECEETKPSYHAKSGNKANCSTGFGNCGDTDDSARKRARSSGCHS